MVQERFSMGIPMGCNGFKMEEKGSKFMWRRENQPTCPILPTSLNFNNGKEKRYITAPQKQFKKTLRCI